MLFDGIKLVQGSEVQNLVVDSGIAFPSSPGDGELFYMQVGGASTNGLYVYESPTSSWVRLVQQTDSFAALLPPSGVAAGTYKSVTVNIAGIVTAGTNPTTLAGYGITDAQPLDADITAIASISATSGLLRKTAADTWSLDTSTYITGNQAITLSGDVTGTGTTSISATLGATGVAAGSYGTVTSVPTLVVDSKGRITSASNTSIAIDTSAVISGTFANARISQLSVTQYQSALSITEAQVTGTGTILARIAANENITGVWSFANEVAGIDPTSSTHLATKNYVDKVAAGLTSIPNSALSNSTITVGTTSIALGAASTVLAGLTSVTSTNFVGALTGHASADLPLSGGTLTGTLILASDPTAGLEAATKNYVDAAIAGLSWKNEVAVATTANITLSGEQTIDGVLTSSSRVLVKNQTDASQNGIYVSGAGAWTRSTDTAIGAEIQGLAVYVNSGSTQATSAWVNTNTSAPTLGTTNITFVQFSGSGAYVAGSGLTLTGNTFSLTNSSLTVNGVSIPLGGSGTVEAAAGTLTGTTLASNIVSSSLTSVGTLTSLNVSGAVAAASFSGAGTGLTGTAAGLSIGGNATTASTANALNSSNSYSVTGLSTAAFTALGNAVTQAAPSATAIATTAALSIADNGSNGLWIGQNTSANGFTTWLQSSYTNPTTAVYPLALNPLGGNVGIGLGASAVPAYTLDISGTGVPLRLNSADSNNTKIRLSDAGVTRGYWQSDAAQPFAVVNAAGSLNVLNVDNLGNGNFTGLVTVAGLTSNANNNPLLLNSLNSAADKIVFQDNGTIRGYIQSNATYCFATSNAANSIQTFLVDNSGNSTSAGTSTATNFIGPGTGLTGTAASLTVGNATLAATASTANALNSANSYSVASIATTGFTQRSVVVGIVAAGTTQTTATVLTKEITVITGGTGGVVLPNSIGTTFIVWNNTGSAVNVYPPVGSQIDYLAGNAALSMPSGSRLMFVQVSGADYATLNATYA